MISWRWLRRRSTDSLLEQRSMEAGDRDGGDPGLRAFAGWEIGVRRGAGLRRIWQARITERPALRDPKKRAVLARDHSSGGRQPRGA